MPTLDFGLWTLDLACLCIIVAGWLGLLLLIPPQHEYPIIDDWIYARSVQHQVETGAFQMPGQSQASLVGLTLWGTIWVRLFGFSFTTLTYSTLVLMLAALSLADAVASPMQMRPASPLTRGAPPDTSAFG